MADIESRLEALMSDDDRSDVERLLELAVAIQMAASQGGDLDVLFVQARPLVVAQVNALCIGAKNLGPRGKQALRALGLGPESARRVAEALLAIYADEEARA